MPPGRSDVGDVPRYTSRPPVDSYATMPSAASAGASRFAEAFGAVFSVPLSHSE